MDEESRVRLTLYFPWITWVYGLIWNTEKAMLMSNYRRRNRFVEWQWRYYDNLSTIHFNDYSSNR